MGNNLIDMHTHTNASDGDYSCDELINKAKAEGIKTLAITDHDTLLGVQSISLDQVGIEVIPGIEISVKIDNGRLHILGYDFDIYDKKLNDKMKELQSRSFYSVMGIICQIKKDYGIEFNSEEVLSILNKKTNIGRPDIAKLMIKLGYVGSVKEAFDSFLTDAYKRMGNISKGISKKEAVELIKSANGLVVLAHPHSLNLNSEELDKFVEEMVDYGLDGIEIYHSNHTDQMMEEYRRLAEKYDLFISGGSDYHGPGVKPDVFLGTGRGNIKIKQLSLLDEIHRRQKKSF